MDPKKVLAKYCKASLGLTITAWVLVGLTVLMIILGIGAHVGAQDVEAVEFFPSESEVGSYVYIDVVGISPWLYKYDDAVYFSVEDTEGYLYTIRWTEAKRDKLTEYHTYWERDDDSVPMPEPIHLCGIASTVSKDTREALASVWDISELEYNQYFGTLFMNANSTPSSSESSPFWVMAMFFGIFGLLLLICTLAPNKTFNNSIKVLEAAGELDRAAEELSASEYVTIGKDRGRMTSRYLFGKGTGVIVRYSDIVWAYKQTQRRNFVNVNAFLIVNTLQYAGLQAVNFGRHDKKNEIEQALVFIAQRNPNTFIGYTQPNVVAYNELKMAAKQQ